MSGIYDKAREKYLISNGDFDADTVKVVPVDATYVYAQTHQFLSQVLAGTRCATPVALAGKTGVDGIAQANDVTFPAVAGGRTITGFVVYIDTGVEGTSTLLCYINKDSLGGSISFPTNGGDIVIRFGGGTKNIFRL